MKYIIFSKLNRNHFLFLSYFIIAIIKDIVNKYIIIKTNDLIKTFHKYYINSLSDFLSIIPFIIIKVRSKRNLIQNNESFSYYKRQYFIKNIYKSVGKKRKGRILKLSILVAFLDFLASVNNFEIDGFFSFDMEEPRDKNY